MPRRLTQEEVIKRFIAVHGDEYDYSRMKYDRKNKEVQIGCYKHGYFWQLPHLHWSGCGCPECAREKQAASQRKTTEQFIVEAREVHGDKYDYSLSMYKGAKAEVCIICHEKDKEGNEHGIFWQTPDNHLHGKGCPKCAGAMKKYTNQFITDAEKVHGKGRYDYTYSCYENAVTPLWIICMEEDEYGNKHGAFLQKPNSHLSGCGCPTCGGSKAKTTEDFITESEMVHGKGRYDYSISVYTNANTYTYVICHRKGKDGIEHGAFPCTPYNHVHKRQGCPKCRRSHMEEETEYILKTLDVEYITQCDKHTFEWLGKLKIDFYLPEYNIAIECQGEQHFRPVEYYGGEIQFKLQQERDERKKRLCEEHGIQMFYIWYNELLKDKLLEIVKNKR